MGTQIWQHLEKANLAGLKKVEALYPASVNLKSTDGRTPLHVAALVGPAFVKELLTHGALHDAADKEGNLPLHLAADKGDLESVAELLTGPARRLAVKVKNKEGQTALHLAVRNEHTAVAAKLLECGARVDAKDKAGQTPLELVSPTNEELLQLLLGAAPVSGNSMGIGTGNVRGSLDMTGLTFGAAGGAAAAAAVTPHVARHAVRPAPAATPSPAPAPATARGPAVRTPGGATPSPAPRVVVGRKDGPGTPAAKGGDGPAAAALPTVGPTPSAQLAKHEAMLQTLYADVRANTERLGALDACTDAQKESSELLDRCLGLCGEHTRQLGEVEARLGFQEEKGKDARSRVEKLEEGERSMQDAVSRLTTDQRGLLAQLRELTEQVARQQSGPGGAAATAAVTVAASHHAQLQAELAALKGQVDALSPALAAAHSASTEARALSARVDTLAQQHGQQGGGGGGSAAVEQQLQQLQAQVQLLQLPVAGLTQQCADLSTRLTALSEQQAAARGDIVALTNALQEQKQHLPEVVGWCSSTMEMMKKLQEQQAATQRELAELKAQQPGREGAAPPALPPVPELSTPSIPGTPNGARSSPAPTPPDAVRGTPLRSFSHGGVAAAQQEELRREVELLKDAVADVRNHLASECGKMKRDFDRALEDTRQRLNEKALELGQREAALQKHKNDMLVEEAEQRGTAAVEKVAKRVEQLDVSLGAYEHRLEVVEEKVADLAAALQGANTPSGTASPGRVLLGAPTARLGGMGRSGPGPVMEQSLHSPGQHLANSLLASLGAAPVGGHGKGGWERKGSAVGALAGRQAALRRALTESAAAEAAGGGEGLASGSGRGVGGTGLGYDGAARAGAYTAGGAHRGASASSGAALGAHAAALRDADPAALALRSPHTAQQRASQHAPGPSPALVAGLSSLLPPTAHPMLAPMDVQRLAQAAAAAATPAPQHAAPSPSQQQAPLPASASTSAATSSAPSWHTGRRVDQAAAPAGTSLGQQPASAPQGVPQASGAGPAGKPSKSTAGGAPGGAWAGAGAAQCDSASGRRSTPGAKQEAPSCMPCSVQ